LAKIAHLQAAAILADGDPAFVLDVPGILEKIKALPVQEAARIQDQPGHAVMVVDDSLTTRKLMEGILSAEGYRVVPAGSGDQALEIMETDKVDLFVVDIEMPGLDGFELSERIRRSRQYQATPIIILSTRGSDADKQKGMAVGANAYIVKSTFDQEEFLATVGSLIS
jgi:two-component system chemotaxis sensor kinase CheA